MDQHAPRYIYTQDYYVVLMLDQRLKRCTSLKSALVQRLVVDSRRSPKSAELF